MRSSSESGSAPKSVAGWSSPVARQAHNLKVTGSNPVPATNDPCKASAAPRAEDSAFADPIRRDRVLRVPATKTNKHINALRPAPARGFRMTDRRVNN
jgi:hypothetical protein